MQFPIDKNQLIAITDLEASKTNPRTHFDEIQLKELAANLTKHGFLQSLIVRPTWCQGCRSEAEINAVKNPPWPRHFEIVDGERRYRAAQLAGIEQIPCDVRELTDTLVVEIQLITFLLKEPLSPLEESKGFQRLLDLKDEAGTALHTASTIAARVGKKEGYIYERLKLAELPEAARAALNSGKIGVKLAVLIARIPSKEHRLAAAKEILHGGGNDEPMSVRQANDHVAEHCMQELKGAPFILEDAELVPAAGPCTTCPHRTGNNRELFGDVKRGDICTNPECFRQKCDAVWARQSAEAAKSPGVTVLPAAEHASLFSHWGDGTELAYDSPWVDLETKPSASLLKHDVLPAKVPLWRDLIDGQEVPVTIARDGQNRLRRLAPRALCVTAAIENKEPIFATGANRRADSSSGLAANRRAQAEHKKEQAIGFAATRAVRDAIVKKGLLTEAWPVLLELALGHAGFDGTWYIAKRDGLKTTQTTTTTDILRKHLRTLKSPEQIAATIEMLYMRSIRHGGVFADEEFKAIARLYEVDLIAIRAQLAVKAKAVKPAAAKPTKGAAAKAVAAVKGSKPASKRR